MPFTGNKYEEYVKDGRTYQRRTKEWENYSYDKLLNLKLVESNLGFMRGNYCFDTYKGEDKNKNIPKLKKYISEFKTKFRSHHLYVYGSVSIQKTISVGIVGKELLIQDFTVVYITMVELLNLILGKMFNKTSEKDFDFMIQQLEKKDFLIIDRAFSFDISKKLISAMDAFLRKRLEEDKMATCFIAHDPVSHLETKGFGKGLTALIKRTCYPMKFEDSINDFDIDSLFDDI